MKNITVAAILCLISAARCLAAIEPVIINLASNTSGPVNTYTVPIGKILIIENATYHVNFSGNPVLFLMSKGSVTNFAEVEWGDKIFSFCTPVRIPEDWKLYVNNAHNNNPTILQRAVIYGVLVDPSDLFASIGSEINSLSVDGAEMQLNVAAASPRPANISVDKSTDATNWESVPDAVTHKLSGSNTNMYTTVLTASDDLALLRVRVRGRP